MKKIVVSISMLIVIFGCTASAEVSERSGDVVTLTPNISEKSVSDINQIGMKFCNDGLIAEKLTSQLHMQLQPGKRQEICTVFYSRFTSGTVKIDFGFTEGIQRDDGTVSCSQKTTDNTFLAMMQNNTKNYSFDLSGGAQSIKKFNIAIPTTATGNIYGCISYTLPAGFTKNTGDVFGIVIRKVAPIEIIVTGDVYRLGGRDDMKNVYTTNRAGILKIIIALLALRLITTIIKTAKGSKKEEKHHTTHNTKAEHHIKK